MENQPEEVEQTETPETPEETAEEETPTETPETPEETPQEKQEAETPEVENPQPIAKFRMTADKEKFSAILKAIATVTDEPNFQVSQEGLTLRTMDASRVAMIDFKYLSERLDTYLFDVEGSFKCSIEEMQKIIARAGKDDSITLETNPDTAKVTITITGEYERVFNLPLLIADEGDEVPIPKIEWKANVKTTVEALQKALGDVALVTDHVKILANSETLKFEGRGDLSNADITFTRESDMLFSLEAEHKRKPTTAVYSLSYLQEFAKAVSKDTIANLSYSQDLPLKLDVSNGLGNITFYLAPRIETE